MAKKLFLPRPIINTAVFSLSLLIMVARPVMAKITIVGGEVYPVNKLDILMPWLISVAAIAIGVIIVWCAVRLAGKYRLTKGTET